MPSISDPMSRTRNRILLADQVHTRAPRSALQPRLQSSFLCLGRYKITLPIHVNEQIYNDTANCHAALLRLREIGESRIWIDAISINQKDNSEKAIQIGLMADIYYLASEVIVWLGRSEAERLPDDEDNEWIGLELVRQLSILKTEKKYEIGDYLKETTGVGNIRGRWHAFFRIMAHSWFGRVWTLQETTVAKTVKAFFQYPSISLWRILDAVILALRYYAGNDTAWNSFVTDEKLDLKIFKFSSNIDNCYVRQKVWDAYDRNKRKVLGMPLLEILDRTLKLKCFEPKDRIFVIIALLDKNTIQRIGPNYASPLSELYRKTTQAIVEGDESLEVICLSGVGSHANAINSFPTWVVDWRADYHENRSRACPLIYRIYRSSPERTRAISSFGEDRSTLSLAGLYVDTISGSLPLSLPEDVNSFSLWATRAEGLAYWKQRFTTYPSGCDPHDAWVRTITGDRLFHNRHRVRLLEEDFLVFKRLCLAGSNTDENPDKSPSREERYEFIDALQNTLESRKFFVSKAGYMGVGPTNLQEGDLICVFPGCNLCLLLRKEKDHYLLIGECFVWGLMNSEAWDDQSINSWKDKGIEELTEEDGLELFQLH